MITKQSIRKTTIWRMTSPIYYIFIRPIYDKVLAPLYYYIEISICNFRYKKEKDLNPYNIPIIINNFNRLSYLKLLIESLEKRGYHNIYIIDNKSSYPPLIEFYNKCNYPIFRLENNIGFKALWKSGIYNKFKHSYYVYTDSDMQIDDCCPNDFMAKFINILETYPTCYKVGFGLKLEDIPSCFIMKENVLKQEKRFWSKEIAPNLFDATIDTTFALYRPYTKGPANSFKFNIRTGFPYLIKHLPWYVDSNNLSQEDIYYSKNATQSTFWTKRMDLQYGCTKNK